ncbi:MAG: hypothetical protein M9934_13800 [Thermomicrobiales bacterium]|nr:hypothetical protein [Thermomicrobiales bacterium]
MDRGRAIIITGTVGVGKTTTMAALTAYLEDHDVSCAGIDMDALRWFYPHPEGDRFGSSVGRKHLAYLAASYHELGIPLIVLADVVEHENDHRALAAAMPQYDIHVIRLRLGMDAVVDRLRQREDPERLAWYLHRAPELEAIQDDAGVGNMVIDIADHSPREIAMLIADNLHLLT